MSNDDYAFKVEKVNKSFKLPHEKVNSLKSLVTQGYKRKKGYETQHALNDISFTIKPGEFFGIVGRNGSGKSTLLKILAGIYQPTSGTVKSKGRVVPFIELGVGFNPELTGRENVYLNGALLGFTKQEVVRMYDDIVSFAELEGFMDQKLKNYSSGMQVRLAFSVATRAEADILIVDEVLAVGDADFQRKCFKYFKQLKKDGKTVVFVSHDMNAVREYCDRAILIERSNIIESGAVSVVASAYTKMFISGDNTSSTEQRIARKRWGSNDLQYTGVSMSQQTYTELDDLIVIRGNFKANKKVANPVFGFTVKNGVGTEMLGSNTVLAHYDTKVYEEGNKILVEWTIPNILNDGEYSVDVTIINRDTLSEYDWWEDAANFAVIRTEHTAFVVEPKSQFAETTVDDK